VALFVLTMHATVLPVDVARAEQATVPLQHAMLSFGPQQNLGADDSTAEWTVCGPTSGPPCDDLNSIVLGSSTYDDGWVAAGFSAWFPEHAECYNMVTVEMSLQTNGPTDSSEPGWVGAELGDESGYSNRLAFHAWDDSQRTWDLVDANSNIEFQTGNRGTVATQNDGVSFRTVSIEFPTEGLVERTGREGVYLIDEPEGGSTATVRIQNHPFEDDGASTDLRTEIREVTFIAHPSHLDPRSKLIPTAPSNVSGGWVSEQVFDIIDPDSLACDPDPRMTYTAIWNEGDVEVELQSEGRALVWPSDALRSGTWTVHVHDTEIPSNNLTFNTRVAMDVDDPYGSVTLEAGPNASLTLSLDGVGDAHAGLGGIVVDVADLDPVSVLTFTGSTVASPPVLGGDVNGLVEHNGAWSGSFNVDINPGDDPLCGWLGVDITISDLASPPNQQLVHDVVDFGPCEDRWPLLARPEPNAVLTNRSVEIQLADLGEGPWDVGLATHTCRVAVVEAGEEEEWLISFFSYGLASRDLGQSMICSRGGSAELTITQSYVPVLLEARVYYCEIDAPSTCEVRTTSISREVEPPQLSVHVDDDGRPVWAVVSDASLHTDVRVYSLGHTGWTLEETLPCRQEVCNMSLDLVEDLSGPLRFVAQDTFGASTSHDVTWSVASGDQDSPSTPPSTDDESVSAEGSKRRSWWGTCCLLLSGAFLGMGFAGASEAGSESRPEVTVVPSTIANRTSEALSMSRPTRLKSKPALQEFLRGLDDLSLMVLANAQGANVEGYSVMEAMIAVERTFTSKTTVAALRKASDVYNGGGETTTVLGPLPQDFPFWCSKQEQVVAALTHMYESSEDMLERPFEYLGTPCPHEGCSGRVVQRLLDMNFG